jgi:hypothetical protein
MIFAKALMLEKSWNRYTGEGREAVAYWLLLQNERPPISIWYLESNLAVAALYCNQSGFFIQIRPSFPYVEG